MITIQQVWCGQNIRGYATIDSNNKDTFWITYIDWDLVQKTGKPIMFRNMPFPRYGPCWFEFGEIIETYD